MKVSMTVAALFVLGACGGKPKDELASKTDSTAPLATAQACSAPIVTVAVRVINDSATVAGNLGVLVELLMTAGLVETLKGTAPSAVLAATGEAFAKLPTIDLQAFLGEKEKLMKILNYHFIGGDVPASQILKTTDARKLEGAAEIHQVIYGKFVLNGNGFVSSDDIRILNGVIHA